MHIRPISPSDYQPVISVIDDWWGGRHMADMLPRLFFEHFTDTSFAAEHDGRLAGFLIGFLSQSRPGEAYIHFVGVNPADRARGLGRDLYQHFFAAVRSRGATVVRAVTSPVNTGSVSFHRQLGFTVEPPAPAYDGPGQDRVRFTLHLA
jgi:ribosomal protein S18 acetylase RimI-like enzyme